MGDDKRPKPSDESTETKRWRPGQPLAQTAAMPAVPSRRATVAMGTVSVDDVTKAVSPLAIPIAQPTPAPPSTLASKKRDPVAAETLPPPTMQMSPLGGRADVEIVVVEETQASGSEKRAWRAAEVWTKRRVYGLDSTFKCVEIVDRESGKPDPSHDMLGARLGGGRHRESDKVRFSYPLPLPGMEAMFMKAKKHGYTSPVERMIVRIRVLLTSADETMPTWDEIGARWSDPPGK